MATDHPIVSPSKDGVRVAVKLTPNANREFVAGIVEEADGNRHVKVSVTLPPEKGRANKAMVALLAKCWSVPKGSMTIVKGETDRRKVVEVSGNTDWLFARIDAWVRRLEE